MDRYPIKAPKKKPVPIYLKALVVKNTQGQFLLEKMKAKSYWQAFGISP
ncbi:A/G-specific adenine glycosylase [Streptococcus mitis]|uniref:A/G-specific adenine glycosylase n=1 Tax=Streptococcus mitis TaxID=28037 RepID=A0A139RAJ0_STRMT|nr:A/G-specific adenine glycosylase [Streptococcus mitis]